MNGLPLAFAGIFLAAALSGCAQTTGPAPTTEPTPMFDEASPAIYAIQAPEEVWVTASDGMRMNNAIYRPDTTEPVPVFINFSPYWEDTAMTEGDAFAQYMIHEYVPRGYAVVLSAVRGTGHSEGCFEVGSDRESRDLNEVVDFFSKEPWSNGNVAAGGKSYDSTSQNGMVAKFPHPALKGLFHVSGITDMYRYTYQNGVPARADAAAFQTTYGVGQGASEYGSGGGTPVDGEDPESLARITGDANCVQQVMGVANPGASMVTGVKTPYWVERDWTRNIATSSWNGSIFFVHGLQDWNVQPSHILPWLTEVQKNPNIKVLGWLHQWTRSDQVGGDGHVYPKRTDWNETMLAWMDSILKGKNTPLVYGYDVQATDMQWRHSEVWPPGTSQVGTGPGSASRASYALAPSDQAARLSGTIILNVTATSNNPDPVFTAVLYDVESLTGPRTWIGEAVLRGVLRNSLETPAPIVPGISMTYRLETYPLDHVFLPGHMLEVALGDPLQNAVLLPQWTQGITYDGYEAALPVTAADTGLLTVQPILMDCFTC